MPILDPTQKWMAVKPPLDRYFLKRDAHLSADGYALMGRWLAAEIRLSHADALEAGASKGGSPLPR